VGIHSHVEAQWVPPSGHCLRHPWYGVRCFCAFYGCIYECVCTQIPTLSHTHSYSLILMHSYTHKHTHTHTHTVDARTERTMRRMARASLAKMGTMFHSNKFETGLLTIASRSHVIWNALMLLLEPGECVCGCVCDVLQLIGIDTR
jgi:hypothetical protein